MEAHCLLLPMVYDEQHTYHVVTCVCPCHPSFDIDFDVDGTTTTPINDVTAGFRQEVSIRK